MLHQIQGREEDSSGPQEFGDVRLCETCANYFNIIQHCDQSNVCDFGACLLRDVESPSFVDVVNPEDTCREWDGED